MNGVRVSVNKVRVREVKVGLEVVQVCFGVVKISFNIDQSELGVVNVNSEDDGSRYMVKRHSQPSGGTTGDVLKSVRGDKSITESLGFKNTEAPVSWRFNGIQRFEGRWNSERSSR